MNGSYLDSYLPIYPDFIEIIENYISNEKTGKVHFFDTDGQINDAQGTAEELLKTDKGIYLLISNNQQVRIDKIITLMGRPGPAYEQYDRYANACLTCENLEQFGT